MKPGCELIAEERARQVAKEGWTPEHDDEHAEGSLARAAACYATPQDHRRYYQGADLDGPPADWPWDAEWWKPKDRLRDLVRAGALIAAEIDRLERAREKFAIEKHGDPGAAAVYDGRRRS